MVLENQVDNNTHFPLSPPHLQSFSLCPGLIVAMKTPRPHFHSGQLCVFQTLNSVREKICMRFVFGK